jgi:hypothetical protein
MVACKLRDIVKCSRAGRGLFKVIDIRLKTKEALIQSVDNPSIKNWFYFAHLSTDAECLRYNKNSRFSEANKILNKFKS